jgi:hypothetical protein
MNRLLIFLILISLSSCSNKPKLLHNGLTKKASQLTEYTIAIGQDSLNATIHDTISIIIKKYNENDHITSLHQQYLFSKDTMDISYVYNKEHKILKEVVKLSTERSPFTVDYFYKDTLLIKTQSFSNTDVWQFKQIGGYIYNAFHQLKESSLKQIIIDPETKDTTTNNVEVRKYNDKELVTEHLFTDFINPERNQKSTFLYKDGNLMETKEYNSKDSLLLTTNYNYTYDTFKNWTKIELIENGKLKLIRTRTINYK